MKYAMIGTWKMAFDGICLAETMLKAGLPVSQAIEKAVCEVENNPAFISVGYGGLPNSACEVELDSAYMDGNTLRFGGIMGVQNIKNPIKMAISLSSHRKSCLLCGKGAELYAQHNGFEFQNMLVESSQKRWAEANAQRHDNEGLNAYAGHDTVCMIGLDTDGAMGVGVSTSGLFMKHPGRVGDSPIIGSGYYCDSMIGGATATGLGEDIMKGCLSFEIVRCMKDGLSPQEACEKTLFSHCKRLRDLGYDLNNIGVVAMDKHGSFGAASSLKTFAFIVATESQSTSIYIAHNNNDEITIDLATKEDLDTYADA